MLVHKLEVRHDTLHLLLAIGDDCPELKGIHDARGEWEAGGRDPSLHLAPGGAFALNEVLMDRLRALKRNAADGDDHITLLEAV